MNTVEPIRDRAKIKEMQVYLESIHPKWSIMFKLGVLTGLRVSDILNLKVEDVDLCIKVKEQKTSKYRRINVPGGLYTELKKYIKTYKLSKGDYLIFSNKRGKEGQQKAVSRQQAYRVLRDASSMVGLKESIGTHGMRKTMAYHLYQKDKDIALVQYVLNHSSSETTLRYIGVRQEQADECLADLSDELF
ncbi:TPA: tyrosine-type recombinase/integrase [Clostridioides difficile]